MKTVRSCVLPSESLLNKYVVPGTYTDCFCIEASGNILHPLFVFAFYTSWLFKLERWILRRLFSIPSSDSEAMSLAVGESEDFAAWRVEGRIEGQLLLTDIRGRTRSWLMVAPDNDQTQTSTRLYFGSAVVPPSGKPESSGPGFFLLIGFHKFYSRLLLRAARSRLRRLATRAEADQQIDRLSANSKDDSASH